MTTTLKRLQHLYKRWTSFVRPFEERKRSKPISKHAPFLQMERLIEFGLFCLTAWVGSMVTRLMTRLAARLGASKESR